MKRALTIALALALPLFGADEAQQRQQETQADSPLVAAAKRANRKGRKSSTPVITNETLKQTGSKARITTTASQAPIVLPRASEPPRPTPEMVHAEAVRKQQERAAADAETRRNAEEERRKAAAAAAAAAEEGLFDDLDADPAQAEKAQQESRQQKPPR